MCKVTWLALFCVLNPPVHISISHCGVCSFNPISQIRELRLGNLLKVMQKMWAGGAEQDFHPSQVLLGCGLQG